VLLHQAVLAAIAAWAILNNLDELSTWASRLASHIAPRSSFAQSGLSAFLAHVHLSLPWWLLLAAFGLAVFQFEFFVREILKLQTLSGLRLYEVPVRVPRRLGLLELRRESGKMNRRLTELNAINTKKTAAYMKELGKNAAARRNATTLAQQIRANRDASRTIARFAKHLSAYYPAVREHLVWMADYADAEVDRAILDGNQQEMASARNIIVSLVKSATEARDSLAKFLQSVQGLRQKNEIEALNRENERLLELLDPTVQGFDSLVDRWHGLIERLDREALPSDKTGPQTLWNAANSNVREPRP